MSRRILVVCAHAGDEILGCGGTLLRHVRRGDRVRVAVLGEGWTSRAKSLQKGLEALDLEAFELQARRALQTLSILEVFFHQLPDNRFDSLPLFEIVQTVRRHNLDFRPHVVYTNSLADLGADQRITARAVLTAFTPGPEEDWTEILAFEVRSSTEWANLQDHGFQPNLFVDVSATLETKLSALRVLETENRPSPHSRSLDAVLHQARRRGASVGVEVAEAYAVLRSVVRENRIE